MMAYKKADDDVEFIISNRDSSCGLYHSIFSHILRLKDLERDVAQS